MTDKYEQLSALVDGEHNEKHIIDSLMKDDELKQKWGSYHLVRSCLRKESAMLCEIDLSASIANAIADEPTVLAPKRKRSLPIIGEVVPFTRQIGQFAMAATVAAVAILGVQQVNHEAPSEPFQTAAPIVPQGGLAPVSLEQVRTLPQQNTGLAQGLDSKSKINALFIDHQRQVQLKRARQAEEQVEKLEEDK